MRVDEAARGRGTGEAESVSDAGVFARPPVMAAEWNRALHLTAAVARCVRALWQKYQK